MDDTTKPDRRTLMRRARKAGEPPKPGGRPRKAETRVALTIRLTPARRAAVKAAAEARGLTETALVEEALTAVGL